MMHNHREGQRSTEAEAKLEAEIEALTSQEAEAAATLKKKIPLPLKVFAILCIVAGVAILPMIGFVIVAMVMCIRDRDGLAQDGVEAHRRAVGVGHVPDAVVQRARHLAAFPCAGLARGVNPEVLAAPPVRHRGLALRRRCV